MAKPSPSTAADGTAAARTLAYTAAELEPYVDWRYLRAAWGLPFGAGADTPAAREGRRLTAEAAGLLRDEACTARARFALLPATAEGDDIVAGGVRLPMLRQQRRAPGERYCRSLADYIGGTDPRYRTLGVFVATASVPPAQAADDYGRMLRATLADRLAEAAAERMHREVRRHYWGYAPQESLGPAELFEGRYTGLRPAVGYPSLPDQSLAFELDRLIDFSAVGVELTPSGMMRPHASVCGLMLAHPAARHFAVGPVGADQLADYARRRGLPADYLRRFLRETQD